MDSGGRNFSGFRLLNGKLFLFSDLRSSSSSSNQQLPTEKAQAQYGIPLPFFPNLNSLPENTASMMGMGLRQTMSSPSTPASLEKISKRIQDTPAPEIIDLVEEGPTLPNFQGKQFTAEHPTALCFSTSPMVSSQIVSTQQKEIEMSLVEEVCHRQLEIEKQTEGENQDIDLNKTPPQQKPRRKKHRPKVIREGKPKRTPKPATEDPKPKRKYVRKKKDLNSLETPSSALGEIVDPDSSRNRGKSVRRSLNFDLEDSQARDVCLESASMFTFTAQDREAACAATASPACSTSKPTMHSDAQERNVVVQNSTARVSFDLNSSMDNLPSELLRIIETSTPPPKALRRETMRINQMPTNQTPHLHSSGREQEYFGELPRERSLETGQDQLQSNNIPEMLTKGTKRGYSFIHNARVPAQINFAQSNDDTDQSRESHDMNREGLCLSEINKKKRTENGENGSTPDPSSIFTYTPTVGWKPNRKVSCNSEVFTFADAQRFMALEKVRGSQQMLVFEQGETSAEAENRSVQIHNRTHNQSTPVQPSVNENNMCFNQPPTPEKRSESNVNQERKVSGPQDHEETAVVNHQSKPKATRKPTKKKKLAHLDSHMSPNNNQTCIEEHGVASCTGGSSPAQKSVLVSGSVAELVSGNSKEKNTNLQINLIQDCQSSSNYEESLRASLHSGAIVPYGDPVDDIVRKLRRLNINVGHEDVAAQAQNALVPYGGGGGVMVAYEGPFDHIRKRRPRAKVDLDPESHRVWKLLMGKESDDGDREMDMDKEKWWEEERRIFRGRADSFIARMHLVQGDRRFSRWKGSVVDSVIGVFLTQNVSDHLSSSAFMALASRFPHPSRSNGTRNAQNLESSIVQQDGSLTGFDATIRWQQEMLGQQLRNRGSLVIHEAERMDEKEIANSNESHGSNTGGSIVDYSKAKSSDFHETEVGVGHESPDSGSGTAVTVTGSTSVAEGEDRRAVEDVISSQNSILSSQNSSECLGQTAEQSILSSLLDSEVDDLLIGGFNGLDSKSFTELLQMAESRKIPEMCAPGSGRIQSTEYFSEMDQSAFIGADNRSSVSTRSDCLNGASPSIYTSNSHLHPSRHDLASLPYIPSPSYCYQNSLNSRFVEMENANALRREDSRSHLPPDPSEIGKTNKFEIMGKCGISAENSTKDMAAPISKHGVQPITSSGAEEVHFDKHSCLLSNLQNGRTEEREAEFQMDSSQQADEAQDQMLNCRTPPNSTKSHNNPRNTLDVLETVESNLRDGACTPQTVSAQATKNESKPRKVKAQAQKKETYDWDSLRRQACCNGAKRERSSDAMDSLDYEAVRCADESEISHTIRERGMNNMLAERIKAFLNRLVTDHGSIDLEWLRDVPPDKAKNYLLSIRGLGLKSVECVRLLTLHHLAFPVDTNVGRICVRLGWVPLQPLPESLQLHLLEMYPVLETIQKYLWPRLCNLDQRTLYELHYQMITFGKVFCTKNKPNCNACPMRGECKHFASAFASARLALPGPEEKGLVGSTAPIASEMGHTMPSFNPVPLPQLEGNTSSQNRSFSKTCEPIIEEPATPEPECIETSESAIEDAFYEDPDEIPTIKLNLEEFTQNLQNIIQENNMELQDGDLSKALVAITPEAASIPVPKLKNVNRLRTEHQVYELPDSHPLLEGLDQRELDDPCPYLLAIWTPGETAQSIEPPEGCCDSQDTGKLCDKNTCFNCNSIREAQAQAVRATLLIPCRTAMRGSFPLNGTYFQVNEVFADHDSSRNPIDVPRDWIWNLPRRTVYFGTSIPTIFKGLTTEGIQHCFWRGFVCVRGFDRANRAPRPLYARLHFPASKTTRNKRAGAAAKKDDD